MLTYIEGLGEVELLPLLAPVHKVSKSTPHQQFQLDFMCHGLDKPIQYKDMLKLATREFGRRIRDVAQLNQTEVSTLKHLLQEALHEVPTVHPSTRLAQHQDKSEP